MSKQITAQAELDEWLKELIEAGYAYAGDRWTLEPNGVVRESYLNEEGEVTEEGTTTLEEIAESVFCWFHDC